MNNKIMYELLKEKAFNEGFASIVNYTQNLVNEFAVEVKEDELVIPEKIKYMTWSEEASWGKLVDEKINQIIDSLSVIKWKLNL